MDFIFKILFIDWFLATLHHLQDVSSKGLKLGSQAVEVQSPNHYTAKGIPLELNLSSILYTMQSFFSSFFFAYRFPITSMPLVEKSSFPWIIFVPLSKTTWAHLCGSTSAIAPLSYWCIYLPIPYCLNYCSYMIKH